MLDRFLLLISHLGLNTAEFERRIGVSGGTISKGCEGKNGPTASIFLKVFKKYPTVNIHWLITGTGEMLLNGSVSQVNESEPDYFKKSAADWKAQCEKWEKMAMGLLEKCPDHESDSSKAG